MYRPVCPHHLHLHTFVAYISADKRIVNGETTPVAIAYHLQKTPYVFPVIGIRRIENLYKNIEALQISLSAEQIAFLESALPFDVGFPNWMIVSHFAVAVSRLESV